MAHRPILPPGDEYWEERKDIFRRLRNLERCAQLGSSSIREGALRILDATSGERARFGQLDATEYGMQVVTETSEAVRLRIDGRGLLAPRMATIPIDPAAFKFVTDPAFTTAWWAYAGEAYTAAIYVDVGVGLNVGTTGELRLKRGANTTDTVLLTSGMTNRVSFKWLHGQEIGAYPFTVEVQARRTGGGGSISLGPPVGANIAPEGATAGAVIDVY